MEKGFNMIQLIRKWGKKLNEKERKKIKNNKYIIKGIINQWFFNLNVNVFFCNDKLLM